MRRREFITLLGGAAAWPLAAHAQQETPVVGYLGTTTPEQDPHFLAAFRRGLNELSFVEGRNLAIEFRWAQGQYERLPELAADLVTRKVNIIAAVTGPAAALAAKAATTTIPFVFVTSLDVVKAGIVASFNRPGGNATGIYLFTRDLEPKKLELLTELAPRAATIAALTNPNSPFVEIQVSALQEAARRLGRKLIVLSAGSESEIDTAFTELAPQRAGGLVVTADPFFNGQRAQLVALAARSAIPAIYEWREFTTAGGLASYGTSITDAYRQAGNYTGRILKGAKPTDLPVFQSTKLKLAINLKTATALGLTIPLTLQYAADEVIE
jgi:putative ABC transport system substrate-binding protein